MTMALHRIKSLPASVLKRFTITSGKVLRFDGIRVFGYSDTTTDIIKLINRFDASADSVGRDTLDSRQNDALELIDDAKGDPDNPLPDEFQPISAKP